jgi:hypothetical protein
MATQKQTLSERDDLESGDTDPYANKSLEELEAELKRVQNADPNDPEEWGVTAKEFDDDGGGNIPESMKYGHNFTYRMIYVGLNIFMMGMLATTPNTAMWKVNEGTIDVGYISGNTL